MKGGGGNGTTDCRQAGKLGQTIDMRTYSGGIVVLSQFSVLRLNVVTLAVSNILQLHAITLLNDMKPSVLPRDQTHASNKGVSCNEKCQTVLRSSRPEMTLLP